MKLISKNFSSENHLVEIELLEAVVAVFIKEWNPSLRMWETKKMITAGKKSIKSCISEPLRKALTEAQEYLGVPLIKAELQKAS